jgi:small neutral amino acid transporter SnatA (MarC family)
MLNGVLAILGSSIITMLILMYSSVIRKALGEIGMHLITRVFGLFMIGSALQIIGENIMYIVKNYH